MQPRNLESTEALNNGNERKASSGDPVVLSGDDEGAEGQTEKRRDLLADWNLSSEVETAIECLAADCEKALANIGSSELVKRTSLLTRVLRNAVIRQAEREKTRRIEDAEARDAALERRAAKKIDSAKLIFPPTSIFTFSFAWFMLHAAVFALGFETRCHWAFIAMVFPICEITSGWELLNFAFVVFFVLAPLERTIGHRMAVLLWMMGVLGTAMDDSEIACRAAFAWSWRYLGVGLLTYQIAEIMRVLDKLSKPIRPFTAVVRNLVWIFYLGKFRMCKALIFFIVMISNLYFIVPRATDGILPSQPTLISSVKRHKQLIACFVLLSHLAMTFTTIGFHECRRYLIMT